MGCNYQIKDQKCLNYFFNIIPKVYAYAIKRDYFHLNSRYTGRNIVALVPGNVDQLVNLLSSSNSDTWFSRFKSDNNKIQRHLLLFLFFYIYFFKSANWKFLLFCHKGFFHVMQQIIPLSSKLKVWYIIVKISKIF